MSHPNHLGSQRKRWKLSDQELSNLLGYRRKSTVSRVEADARAPTIKFALACEVVFGEPPRVMFPAVYAGVEDAVMRRAKKLDDAIRDDASRKAAVKRELLTAMIKRATKPRRL